MSGRSGQSCRTGSWEGVARGVYPDMDQAPKGQNFPKIAFNADGVPMTLRKRPQWVCWRYEQREGKPTKVPVSTTTGTRASSTDPSTWGTFESAVAALDRDGGLAGVGYVFAKDDPFTGIDLDGCMGADGALAAGAAQIISDFASYTEVSPSGTGVKIICIADKPASSGCRSKAIGGFRETEVYSAERYFAITGSRLEGAPSEVRPAQEALDRLCARLWPAKAKDAAARPAPTGTAFEGGDEELLRRAFAARNGEKTRRLFDGDTSMHGDDDSAADLALCTTLAFWCGGDDGRIDRLFRRSGLYREKWDREDYRQRTIRRAVESCAEFYNPTPKGSGGPARTGSAEAGQGAVPVPEQPPSAQECRPCSDLGNAERFAEQHADKLRYCHGTGRWYVWDGRRWRHDQSGTALRLAGETARTIYAEAAGCDDKSRREELAEWALVSESRPRLEAMLVVAKSRPPLVVAAEDMDADGSLLNVLNGTIDLRTGGLRPHRREDNITKLAPVRYDPAASSPLLDQFISRIFAGDESLVGYVQKLLGHCLTGDITEHVFPIFYGAGANGKSVLVDTVMGVMGEYATEAAPQLLVETRGSREHPTEVADLMGRRLVVASETEQGGAFKLALVKRITGDATLKGRFMRQDYFSFPRTHKTIMVTNNKPRVKEDSEAVWRRLRLIPFTVVIPPEERDPKLMEKLKEAWPAVLAWLVRGCLAWRAEGLHAPQAVLVATDEYRDAEDQVGRYLEDRCVVDGTETSPSPRQFTPWAALLADYTAWAEEVGEPAMHGRRLGEALDKRGFPTLTQRFGGKPAKGRALSLRSDARQYIDEEDVR